MIPRVVIEVFLLEVLREAQPFEVLADRRHSASIGV